MQSEAFSSIWISLIGGEWRINKAWQKKSKFDCTVLCHVSGQWNIKKKIFSRPYVRMFDFCSPPLPRPISDLRPVATNEPSWTWNLSHQNKVGPCQASSYRLKISIFSQISIHVFNLPQISSTILGLAWSHLPCPASGWNCIIDFFHLNSTRTRLVTRLPQSRAGGQGPYLYKL